MHKTNERNSRLISLSHPNGRASALERPWDAHLLASLSVTANSMGQAMLPWIELRVLLFFLLFKFLENLTFLLLCQFFAVNACVLGLHLS